MELNYLYQSVSYLPSICMYTFVKKACHSRIHLTDSTFVTRITLLQNLQHLIVQMIQMQLTNRGIAPHSEGEYGHSTGIWER